MCEAFGCEGPCRLISGLPLFLFTVCAGVDGSVSVIRVGALCVVHVAGQHVVVHVDGAAVVDGVAQPLGHHRLAGVRRQAELEEAGLGGGQAVVWLQRHGTPVSWTVDTST